MRNVGSSTADESFQYAPDPAHYEPEPDPIEEDMTEIDQPDSQPQSKNVTTATDLPNNGQLVPNTEGEPVDTTSHQQESDIATDQPNLTPSLRPDISNKGGDNIAEEEVEEVTISFS